MTANMNTNTHIASLLGLPVELQEHIISFISTSASIAALSLSCRHLRDLAEKPLYTSLTLINLKPRLFAATLAANPDRKQLVKHLVVDCNTKLSKDEQETSACTYAALYGDFQNLETLSLASGYWHWDEDEGEYNVRYPVKWESDQELLNDVLLQSSADWHTYHTMLKMQSAGLSQVKFRRWPNLRSLTLDFWEQNGQGCFLTWEPAVFLLPSLEKLSIAGMRYHAADGEDLVDSQHRGKMPLKELVLNRSYIYHEALKRFLAMPKALLRLTLIHDLSLSHHEMAPDGWNHDDDGEHWLLALNQQMHSLETMTMNRDMEVTIGVARDDDPCLAGLSEGVVVNATWSDAHDTYFSRTDYHSTHHLEPAIEFSFTRS